MNEQVAHSIRAGFWTRVGSALPMRAALLGVAAVWALGCVWSFREQSAFAAAKGFGYPQLLPLVIDGFAVSMAGVAWAASLDARPAVPARLATLVAVAGSSTSNGVWAWLRAEHDMVAVALGVAVPVAANLAFEVLLAELRRQVQRRRGLPPPVAVPYPRLIRLMLAPWRTFAAWRRLVLALTDLDPTTVPAVLAPRDEDEDTAGKDAADDEWFDEHGWSRWWDSAPPANAPGPNGQGAGLQGPDRARLLIAAGVGRRRLARELGTSEHHARQLLDRERSRKAHADELDPAAERAGDEEGRS